MLFYLHIPKTGGQTLATRLASAYLRTRVHFMKEDFRFPQGADEIRKLAKTMDFVEGHIAGPVLSGQEGLRVLATVRDPIAQIISSYRHIIREPSNILHRPATEFEFERFFDSFGDNFMNVQARYLATAFFVPTALDRMERYKLWLAQNMLSAIDRLGWFVPSERIDEFVTLWSLEENKQIPHAAINVNVSEHSDFDLARLRNHLHTRTDLYDLDLLLWNASKAWFERYRERIVDRLVSDPLPANGTRAFFENGSGIWLTKGWHPAAITTDNVSEWWAGPSRFSEIVIRRSQVETSLEFEITCVLGFRPNDMLFFAKNEGRQLPQVIRPHDRKGRFWLSLDISSLSCEDTIVVDVPRVLSSFQVSSTDTDSVRRSFATQSWRLGASSSGEGFGPPVPPS